MSLSISFISFIASTMQSTWPTSTWSARLHEGRAIPAKATRRTSPRSETSLRAASLRPAAGSAVAGGRSSGRRDRAGDVSAAAARHQLPHAGPDRRRFEPAAPSNLMRTFRSARSMSNSAIPLAFRKSTSSRNSSNFSCSIPVSSRAHSRRFPTNCSTYNSIQAFGAGRQNLCRPSPSPGPYPRSGCQTFPAYRCRVQL